MKQTQSSKTIQPNSNGKARVENKDNMDSRHKEEELVKGDHITNNQKQHQSLKKSKN